MLTTLPFLAWPRSAGPTLTTLIFHRVLSAPDPLRPGEIDAATFDRYMAMVVRNFCVMPLSEAAKQLRGGRLPQRACCITFDDGYADNLTVAEPILSKHRLTASVFVATGYLDGGRMFNDSVIELVARTPRAVLDFATLGLDRYPVRTVNQKRNAIVGILSELRYLEPVTRERTVQSMIGLAECGPLPNDLMLTRSQLAELARRGVEIGGHTRSHVILSTLDDDAAKAEIVGGKNDIEEIIGRPVEVFAYPNGRPGRDFSNGHMRLVKSAGFIAAVTTEPGVGTCESDLMQIPRFTPWGRSAAMLAARLVRNARGAIRKGPGKGLV